MMNLRDEAEGRGTLPAQPGTCKVPPERAQQDPTMENLPSPSNYLIEEDGFPEDTEVLLRPPKPETGSDSTTESS